MFKRLVKSSLILIGVAFSCPGFSAAAEEADLGRYWAGHKAVLSGETDGDGRLTDINHGKLGCIKIIKILSYRIGFDFNSFR